jgi:hypothetical protein
VSLASVPRRPRSTLPSAVSASWLVLPLLCAPYDPQNQLRQGRSLGFSGVIGGTRRTTEERPVFS